MQGDPCVDGDEIVEGGLDEATLIVEGKTLREHGSVGEGRLRRLDDAADACDGGVVFAVPVELGREPHPLQQTMNPCVLGPRQMAVGIHGEQA